MRGRSGRTGERGAWQETQEMGRGGAGRATMTRAHKQVEMYLKCSQRASHRAHAGIIGEQVHESGACVGFRCAGEAAGCSTVCSAGYDQGSGRQVHVQKALPGQNGM